MADSYEYFTNKRTDRVYLSKSLLDKQLEKSASGEIREIERPFRIVSKIVEATEGHEFIVQGKQICLRITDGARQEIVAKFYEDTRSVFSLQIQKYTIKSGVPHNTHFTFGGNEISTLYNFLRNISFLPIKDEHSAKLDDKFVDNIVLTRAQAVRLLSEAPGLLEELNRNEVTAQDVAVLGYRRKQISEFHSLLTDDQHFELRQKELGANKGAEAVWQNFFERNTWIFGYGLNYVFNSALDNKKLEQVVRGYDFAGAGKIVDALLKTHGLISALSFGEIKTHRANLLKPVASPYRKECWQISDELAGGLAQVQRSVQLSLQSIKSKTEVRDKTTGDPTGEALFLYQPRSFIVIGSLMEFQSPNGINEEKYSSFELFRRNIGAPEIITFDELFERAKFIVGNNSDIGSTFAGTLSEE